MFHCSKLIRWCARARATTDRLPERFEFTQIQMGMPFRIVLYAPDADSANAAARAAYDRIKQFNGIMSDYDPESELMRLCQTAGSGKAVPVSRDLLAVLSKSLAPSRQSDGAFDVTVGPARQIVAQYRARKEISRRRRAGGGPRRRRISQRPRRRKGRHGRTSEAGHAARPGGIAVGYAIDDVLALLKARGITRALVDGSGDIGVGDAPPGKEGWRIGIAPLEADAEPSRYVILKNAAVTTSGDAFQFVELDGKRYSHIVDPRTGLGLTDRTSVTLLAPNCTVADSYTKAVSVLGPEKGLRLIEATPGAAVIIVRAREGTVETYESKRLPDYTIETAERKAE